MDKLQRVTDGLHDFYQISLAYDELLVEEHSDFQHIQIVKSKAFGNVLLLDGIIQLTEKDNFGYHEMLAHIPMLAFDQPKRVMIVGGGDGGALSEVLKYASVEDVTVCELDRRVVELCREHFPQFGDPFGDERVRLVIEDAFDFLHDDSSGPFDIIIADTTDPIGETEKLFSEAFYKLMAKALAASGVIVTQCEQMYFDIELIEDMLGIARKLRKNSAYYYTLVPTYPGGGIGFLYISDVAWTSGLDKQYPAEMKYLNPAIHRAAFALPEFVRRRLQLASGI